jgi:hypothetical protein
MDSIFFFVAIRLFFGFPALIFYCNLSEKSFVYLDGLLNSCKLSDQSKWHKFQWPNGDIKPAEWKGRGDVVGCGILFESPQKLSIFFTLNGMLLDQFSTGILD